MALTQRLLIRQSQALVMTPQLMQAIKLLQLSNLDLTTYVEGELERNPLLERTAEAETPTPNEGAGEDIRTPTEAPAPEAGDWLGQDLDTSRATIEERLDTGDDADYNLEAFVTAETTLAGHLGDQLMLAIADPVRRIIGQHLIDLVDEAGYLTGDLAPVAEKLGAPLPDVEAVLAIVQSFDPAGVAARNLAECLAIQLKERNRFDPAMQALVGHLELLARRDLAGLKKICGVDDLDLAEMIAEIRALNPKPGLALGSTVVQPMVPDVFVRQASGGTYAVELNADTLPKVLVDQTYYAVVAKTARSDTEKSYLNECLQTATWLVRALDQRAKTILKVSTEIVRQQDGFFAHGVQHLRPLNLKTVADAIGMHESTVSRVTANKYMATSRGIFELKYFFTSSIASAVGGEAHSAEAVRHRIKQMIDAEPTGDVLSDDTIVEKLRGAGIDIARRTVAKYREAMKIPSSVQRRREKQTTIGAD